MYEASLSCSSTQMYMPTQYEGKENILPQQHTVIVDSGATHLHIASTAPHGPIDTSAATIKVGTANGKVETSCNNLPTRSLVLDPSVIQTVPSCSRKSI